MFVLMENHNFQESCLGVFDDVDNVDINKLTEHYGLYTELKHDDVRDSGIEWVKTIMWDNEQIILTLCEFELNQI